MEIQLKDLMQELNIGANENSKISSIEMYINTVNRELKSVRRLSDLNSYMEQTMVIYCRNVPSILKEHLAVFTDEHKISYNFIVHYCNKLEGGISTEEESMLEYLEIFKTIQDILMEFAFLYLEPDFIWLAWQNLRILNRILWFSKSTLDITYAVEPEEFHTKEGFEWF